MKNIKVVKENGKKASSTEIDMLVESLSAEEIGAWDKNRVVQSLIDEAGMDEKPAAEIAEKVEQKISKLELSSISTSLIREIINNELLTRGETRLLKKYQSLELPTADLESFLFQKSNSNANINVNNPESVAFFLSENITKQFALKKVFSHDVTQAHLNGRIYIHDLGMVSRLYCFGGNIIEYLKKYGLQELDSLSTKSFPASTASTLIGHINTFLSIIQAYFAGALGMGFVNIFFAPFFRGMSRDEIYNAAQYFIFSLSQNCFSRGAQVLFVDLNLHFGIPKLLADVPAVGPRGKYMIKMQMDDICQNSWTFYNDKPEIDLAKIDLEIKELNVRAADTQQMDVCYGFPNSAYDKGLTFEVMTYKDFEEEAQMFLDVILQLYKEGDKQGNFFYFPKIDLHVDDDTFKDEKQNVLFQHACETASVNGTPYFIFDRGTESKMSMCCRLKQDIDGELLKRAPESARFCAIQNITINLPQAAYRAGKGNFDKFITEIYKAMDIAKKAHEQKARFLKKEIVPGAPLYTVCKVWKDGLPWVDLDKCTRIIGILGLNEAMQYLFGKQLHEDDTIYRQGLKTIASMNQKCADYKKETNLSFTLEETPAESLALRAAKVDLQNYPEQTKEVVKGNIETGEIYYTNSIHLNISAPVSIIERVKKQSAFHIMVKSGSIIHAWVGENLPDPVALASFVEKILKNTQCDQFCVSPNLTICETCHTRSAGLFDNCPKCNSSDVTQVSRVTGYFSKILNWNKGKIGELIDREKNPDRAIPAKVVTKEEDESIQR